MRGAALWMLLAACAGGADDDKTTTVPADGLTSSTTTSTPPTDPDPVDTGRTSTMEPLGDTSVLALPPPGTVANGRFSTADTCAECHDEAAEFWKGTRHAGATALIQLPDPPCVVSRWEDFCRAKDIVGYEIVPKRLPVPFDAQLKGIDIPV